MREFYLELFDLPQFPTSMSLPWLLTEHALAPPSPTGITLPARGQAAANGPPNTGGGTSPARTASTAGSGHTGGGSGGHTGGGGCGRTGGGGGGAHTVGGSGACLLPLLFAPLSAYDSAAVAALSTHRRRHLYAEVEAEVNLCFDQILFELSERVSLSLLSCPNPARPSSLLPTLPRHPPTHKRTILFALT
jgi:hypothetical protein